MASVRVDICENYTDVEGALLRLTNHFGQLALRFKVIPLHQQFSWFDIQ